MNKVLDPTVVDDLRPEYDFTRLREVHPAGHFAARYYAEPVPPPPHSEHEPVDRLLLVLLIAVLGIGIAWLVRLGLRQSAAP